MKTDSYNRYPVVDKRRTFVTKKTLQISLALAALCSASVQAATINFVNSNFTFLNPVGGVGGGTNDIVASWDGTFNTAVSGAGSTNFNMSLSSAIPFALFYWTAHNIRVFGPGTYSFNVDCTTAQLNAGTCMPNANPARNITITVGTGQIGTHILWDWNSSLNVDIVNVWDQNAVFGPSPLYTGQAGSNSPTKVWDLMSTDANLDGINGIPMIDGPLVGFSTNFNLSAVPIPAAFWLFGSGMVGLLGFVSRKKKTNS